MIKHLYHDSINTTSSDGLIASVLYQVHVVLRGKSKCFARWGWPIPLGPFRGQQFTSFGEKTNDVSNFEQYLRQEKVRQPAC